MSVCSKCGVETVCEFDLCAKCYNALNFAFPTTDLKSMYDNNPEARHSCSECGKETEPWNDVCLACEMKYEEKKERKEEK